MFERLFGNPHYKLVSLLVAVGAWLYVQSDEVSTGQLQAKIEWHLAEGLVSVEPLPHNVMLQVRGTRSALKRAKREAIVVPVELKDLGPGEHDLELAPFVVEGLDPNVEVVSRTPSGIRFRLDKQVRHKIAVSARVVGKPADGYAVRGVSVRPAVVLVTGPASVVNRLDQIPTEPIDVAGLMTDLELPVSLALPPPLAHRGDTFTAVLRVVALNEKRSFANVPVQVFGRPGLPDPSTAMVELTGPSTLVRELDPHDLVVFLDPPEDGTGSFRATFGEAGPAGVRVLHGAGHEVRVTALSPQSFEVSR